MGVDVTLLTNVDRNTLETIMASANAPTIRLPKPWKPNVRFAMLFVVSLAQSQVAEMRGQQCC